MYIYVNIYIYDYIYMILYINIWDYIYIHDYIYISLYIYVHIRTPIKHLRFWCNSKLHAPPDAVSFGSSAIPQRRPVSFRAFLCLRIFDLSGSWRTHDWLVVYLPLRKKCEFVSWDDYSQYMEKQSKCSKPPTTWLGPQLGTNDKSLMWS